MKETTRIHGKICFIDVTLPQSKLWYTTITICNKEIYVCADIGANRCISGEQKLWVAIVPVTIEGRTFEIEFLTPKLCKTLLGGPYVVLNVVQRPTGGKRRTSHFFFSKRSDVAGEGEEELTFFSSEAPTGGLEQREISKRSTERDDLVFHMEGTVVVFECQVLKCVLKPVTCQVLKPVCA
ncbi:hypothetical protein CEXT_730051 [Caerostris extrusa]|uniref:Uncharacterized protein n=1 Tax=Caerostris extrusa TaxID=172846 RepID=A0AAV4QI27_CAEEX|nr:hypothetical protein CEXT_730051 [Caerostris extrusa]